MLEALSLLTKMEAPAAFAIVGIALSIGIPVLVRRTNKMHERLEELRLKRAIQLESFKKGALTYTEEP